MKSLFFIVAFFVFNVIVLSFTTFPIVLIILLLLYIFTKNSALFFLAFGYGILLDILSVRTIGISSIVFITIFLLIVLYERKFEIQTLPFVVLFVSFSVFGYLILIGSEQVLEQTLASIFISLIVALGYYRVRRIRGIGIE